MLKYNERLVLPHADGARKLTKYGLTKYWSPVSKFDLMNRLGEYEDTGLTPEEIKGLAEVCKKLLTMHAVSTGENEFYVNHFSVGDLNALLLRIATLLTEGDIHG